MGRIGFAPYALLYLGSPEKSKNVKNFSEMGRSNGNGTLQELILCANTQWQSDVSGFFFTQRVLMCHSNTVVIPLSLILTRKVNTILLTHGTARNQVLVAIFCFVKNSTM